nr:uncharacterized protein LOC110070487 [Pogona vitticeps]
MKEENFADSQLGGAIGAGKATSLLQPKSVVERSEWRRLQEDRGGEGGRGMRDLWETQWQEFLKNLQPIDAGRGDLAGSEVAPWDDAKAFLASFEQVAKACRWPIGEWVARLLPALSGEAEEAFRSLDAQDKEDYGKVKAAILRGDALRMEKQRQHFRHFSCQVVEDPRKIHCHLQELCHRWLRPERRSKEQILELLILEQFLASLPPDLQGWIRGSGPRTCSQAVALVEDILLSRQRAETRKWQGPMMEESLGSHNSKEGPMNASEAKPHGDSEMNVPGGGIKCSSHTISLLPLEGQRTDQTKVKEEPRDLSETSLSLQVVKRSLTQPGKGTMVWTVLQEGGKNEDPLDVGMRMQSKMAESQCGGNKGDVPSQAPLIIPKHVLRIVEMHKDGFWPKDKQGYQPAETGEEHMELTEGFSAAINQSSRVLIRDKNQFVSRIRREEGNESTEEDWADNRPRKKKGRGLAWQLDETRCLLAIWGEQRVQEQLRSSHRNLDTFVAISRAMKRRGFRRSPLECRCKTKSLRRLYKNAVEHNSKPGNSPQRIPFYRELRRILERDPSVDPPRSTDSRDSQGDTTEESPRHVPQPAVVVPIPVVDSLAEDPQGIGMGNQFEVTLSQFGGSQEEDLPGTVPQLSQRNALKIVEIRKEGGRSRKEQGGHPAEREKEFIELAEDFSTAFNQSSRIHIGDKSPLVSSIYSDEEQEYAAEEWEYERRRKKKGRGLAWQLDETRCLLAIWGEQRVQEQLRSSHRNLDTFVAISRAMKRRGFRRSPLECRCKTKSLRRLYKNAVEHNSKPGNSPQRIPYFEELHRILERDASADPPRSTDSRDSPNGLPDQSPQKATGRTVPVMDSLPVESGAAPRPPGAGAGDVVVVLQGMEEADGGKGAPPAESGLAPDPGEGPSSTSTAGHHSIRFESDSAPAVDRTVPNPTVCLSPVVLLTPHVNRLKEGGRERLEDCAAQGANPSSPISPGHKLRGFIGTLGRTIHLSED